jgi:hypothetical protein
MECEVLVENPDVDLKNLVFSVASDGYASA